MKRLSLNSLIKLLICSWESDEHEYMFSLDTTTLGRWLTYSTTFGTSTYPAILVPHRQTKTPILGFSVGLTGISVGYTRSVTSVPRASASFTIAFPAADHPLATDSWTFIGVRAHPHTNIFRFSRSVRFSVVNHPCASICPPTTLLNCLELFEGTTAHSRITRSN